MPRRPRIVQPGTPLHLIQCGNNRQACFYAEEDYSIYLDWLMEYSEKCGASIHAYVLMTNHVHLLITPHNKNSAGKTIGAESIRSNIRNNFSLTPFTEKTSLLLPFIG